MSLARIATAALLLPALALADDPPAPPKLLQDGQARTIAPWTTKGMTVNPVAICFDPAGNLYVAESDRAGNAVQDTRHLTHLHAVEDDLKFKSIEDRRAQIHRWLTDHLNEEPFKGQRDYFTKTEDRVRVLTDTTGTGSANQSKVFAGGFNDELDGIGAGVLWLNGTLYFTCIPNVWALKAAPGSLENAQRTSLSSGYGVRWCFYGHDLHGLTTGPDGRIYFSMGDRGFNITTKEGKHLVGPDRGGVFRCWPDGSELELFYQGLRNPQELAFNDLGDLFTGDNNCDSGDRARVVHIVEGGDSGWRQDVQSLDSRGPWNREHIWKTLADVSGAARPAWTLPPVEYMCAGPSGMSFYPGTGEAHTLDGCMFLVDFYGSGSTVHTFRAKPEGAGFRVVDHLEYYKGVTITDIAWGADGRLYMSDWGGGWDPNPNGMIYTVANTSVLGDATEAAAIKEVGDLIKSGFGKRPADELLALLSHRDQRIRQNAQYELAARGEQSVSGLAALATLKDAKVTTRAHAIWALGQIARKTPLAAGRIVQLLGDPDPEIRTQTVRTLGDLKPGTVSGLTSKCIPLLKDPSARVRLAAAIALGRLGDQSAVAPLLDLLDQNSNADLVIRHGASYALSLTGKPDEIARRAKSLSAPARLGAVIALRRLESEAVAEFLNDESPAVAIESARAIYDLRLPGGMPRLAAILGPSLAEDRTTEPMLRRAIEANVLLGTKDCADRLAAYASLKAADSAWRLLALERLEGWDKPLKREGVWGNWADYPGRAVADVEAAIQKHIDAIAAAAAGDDKLLGRVYRLQVRHALHLSTDQIAEYVADSAKPEPYRLALLEHLVTSAPEVSSRVSESLVASGAAVPSALRNRATELLAKSDPAKAASILKAAASTGEVKDRQQAIRTLATIKAEAGREAIIDLVQKLQSGQLDQVVALDLYEAAMKLPENSPARAAVEPLGVQGSRPKGYTSTLLSFGGDKEAGQQIFTSHPTAECIRCHTINDSGGTAGPDLSKVGSRLTADKMVESLIEPNAVIVKGFGNVTAMPAMAQFLSPRQVRDVVAYLQTLRSSSGGGMNTNFMDSESSEGGSGFSRVLGFLLLPVLAVVIWRGARAR